MCLIGRVHQLTRLFSLGGDVIKLASLREIYLLVLHFHKVGLGTP